MSLKVYVVSLDPSAQQNAVIEDHELVDILGKKEKAVAVRLEELFNSVIERIKNNLFAESELTIEVSGSVELSGEGGVNWLFFDVGGSATKTNVMKVILKTKIKPE